MVPVNQVNQVNQVTQVNQVNQVNQVTQVTQVNLAPTPSSSSRTSALATVKNNPVPARSFDGPTTLTSPPEFSTQRINEQPASMDGNK